MPETLTVYIDEDLEDLIPGFLENRHLDVKVIEKLLDDAEFAEIQRIGHSMKGSGGGYGFDEISQIGKRIEEAATAGNIDKISSLARSLSQYLQNVQIVYTEED